MHDRYEKVHIPASALKEFLDIFTKISPKQLRYALMTVYLKYESPDEDDYKTVEEIDYPLQTIIKALTVMIGDHLTD